MSTTKTSIIKVDNDDSVEINTDLLPIRKGFTSDTVNESFQNLIKYIEYEISELRQDKSKTKGIKFLRSLNKDIKAIQNETQKAFKQSNKKPKKISNGASGFLKPVEVSKELAVFAGWNQSDLQSRVDVTKYICKYIKDNNLQDPKDRRFIYPDFKLNELFGLTSSTNKSPLRYYSLQTHLKHHYPKPT
jgi:chromatin remodeling complex protein RSC6